MPTKGKDTSLCSSYPMPLINVNIKTFMLKSLLSIYNPLFHLLSIWIKCGLYPKEKQGVTWLKAILPQGLHQKA